MAITLTDKDLEDLARLIEDFRHKEASVLLGFLQPRIQEQRMSEMRARTPHAGAPHGDAKLPQDVAPNGHAEGP